jgi:SAM-dependent methyltransferase
MADEFERRLREGATLPFSGWDFSPIAARWRVGSPPWDFASLLRDKMRTATSMVDLGTGGGEFLASLAPLPRNSFATEGYAPNVELARRRLSPLGVRVIAIGRDLRIDLPDRSVDLVADRHEEFSAAEVLRVLRPGGWFVTQQVGVRNHAELDERFAADTGPPGNDVTNATRLAAEVSAAGLVVERADEAFYSEEFLDVGALVFYLRAIPWEFPHFSVDRDREALRAIDAEIRRTGSFRVTAHRLLVTARRPP